MTGSRGQRTTASATIVEPGAERAEMADCRAVLDALDQAVIVTSAVGVVREFNEAAERLTGHRAAEAIGRLRLERLHDASELLARSHTFSEALGTRVEPGFETLLAAARTEAGGDLSWTYLRKDGARIPVSLSIKLIHESSRGSNGVVVVATAIDRTTPGDARPPPPRGETVPSKEPLRTRTPRGAGSDDLLCCRIPRAVCFSPDDVLRRLGDDKRLLDEIVDLFHSERRVWLEAIHRAVLDGDPGAVARIAHKLRGALLNLGAGPAARVALELESCGRGGVVPAAEPVDALASELDQLAAALGHFRTRGVVS
jgi:PAS domain S-box-containing protein